MYNIDSYDIFSLSFLLTLDSDEKHVKKMKENEMRVQRRTISRQHNDKHTHTHTQLWEKIESNSLKSIKEILWGKKLFSAK